MHIEIRHFLSAILILPFSLFGQSTPPPGISYQAVIRSSAGAIVPTQAVRLRMSIRDTTATGTIVYQESHQATTNLQGLVNLIIGQGTVISGVFASINWGTANKYLQVEVDPVGGTSYTSIGTQQMMSVPYALYSQRAGSLDGSGSGSTDGEVRRLKTQFYLSNFN
jgi:hypothetical protein